MYKTREEKLKMFTFIINETNGNNVGVVFGYTLDDAFARIKIDIDKVIISNPEIKATIHHKGTFIVDTLGLEIFNGERKILKPKVEKVGDKLSGLLTYLTQDDNAKKERKKLTTRDISDIKRIINKL